MKTIVHEPICRVFQWQAIWTWRQLEMARKHNHRLAEEGLVDFNLLNIKEKLPQSIRTQTFTKRAEASNGADWEWWFTGSSGNWLGFRVQAKAIDFRRECFPHLHYRLRSGEYQSDLLCRMAKSKPPRIPIYCFFLQFEPPARNQQGPPMLTSFTPQLYGCSIARGDVIKANRSIAHSSHLGFLFRFLRPWHTLVCPDGSKACAEKDLPDRALDAWRTLPDSAMSDAHSDFGVITSPPDYVLRMERGEQIESPDNTLDGVLIIHEHPPATGNDSVIPQSSKTSSCKPRDWKSVVLLLCLLGNKPDGQTLFNEPASGHFIQELFYTCDDKKAFDELYQHAPKSVRKKIGPFAERLFQSKHCHGVPADSPAVAELVNLFAECRKGNEFFNKRVAGQFLNDLFGRSLEESEIVSGLRREADNVRAQMEREAKECRLTDPADVYKTQNHGDVF